MSPQESNGPKAEPNGGGPSSFASSSVWFPPPSLTSAFGESMRQRLHIRTYDSIPTDLAGEMRDWPEFVSGEGYTVFLRDTTSGAEVSVWMTEPENDFPTVILEGTCRSPLLDRALGRVIEALSEHSDNVDIPQSTIAEPGGAANRSQPVTPRTNGTSSAAGSGGLPSTFGGFAQLWMSS